jgi:hypothetical protein
MSPLHGKINRGMEMKEMNSVRIKKSAGHEYGRET